MRAHAEKTRDREWLDRLAGGMHLPPVTAVRTRLSDELPRLVQPNAIVSPAALRAAALAQAGLLLLCWTTWRAAMIPSPGEILAALGDLWRHWGLGVELLRSFAVNVEALAITAVLSLGLAYLTVVPLARPLVAAVAGCRFLGLVGLSFFFTVFLANGHRLKVGLLVFGMTVFFVTGMADVVAGVSRDQLDHARTLRMGPWRVVWEVIVRGHLDLAIDALRQNAAMGWMMLSMVEGLVRSEGGVGAMLLSENKHMRLDAVAAIQLVILATGLLQDAGFGLLKRLACPWSALTRARA